MGRSISFHWFFITLTMVFNIFHCFFHYMVQPKVIMPPWWKDMDFKKKKRVPREKSGRHSNLIYLALNPLKKSGTAFSDFSLFSRCCSLFFQCFFHYFQGVLNYFSLIFQCCYMCFIIFHCPFGYLFCNLHAYSAYLQCHIHGRYGNGRECVKNFGVLGVSGLNK